MASDANNPTFTPWLRSIQNSNRFYESITSFPNDSDPTELPLFYRHPTSPAIAEISEGVVGMQRFMENRRAAGLFNLLGIPVQPESGRRALVVGNDRRRGFNLRTRQLLQGSSTPRFIGQTTNSQFPLSEENSGLTLDEQDRALKKLRKSIYNPGLKRFARRVSLYYRNNAMGSVKEIENEDEDGQRCAVCLEDLEPGEQVAITPCNHMFHEDCIVPWLKSHGQCPVCRFALSKEE